jgi:hypothetical protein
MVKANSKRVYYLYSSLAVFVTTGTEKFVV